MDKKKPKTPHEPTPSDDLPRKPYGEPRTTARWSRIRRGRRRVALPRRSSDRRGAEDWSSSRGLNATSEQH